MPKEIHTQNEHVAVRNVWSSIDINFCDFFLPISVVRNEEAHQIIQSIIIKNTDLNAPDIWVHDERMKRLDSVVIEAKKSEWEAVNMGIYSVAWNCGEDVVNTYGKKSGEILEASLDRKMVKNHSSRTNL